MFRIGIATLSLLAALAAPAAAQTHHRTVFDVKFAGVKVGKATFDITFDDKNYAIGLSGGTAGIAELFAQGSGEVRSVGAMNGGEVQAVSNSVVYREKKKQPATLEMTFDKGAFASLKLDPDKRKKKDGPTWVQVTPEHLAKVIDPASGVVMPVQRERANDPNAVCNRVIPVYDGDSRYDIVLRYKATKPVETEGYKGWAYVCQLRYRPVAGHRTDHKNVRYMADNKLMEIWVAPMAGTNVFTMIRVEVPTWVGRVVAEPVFFGAATN